MNGQMNDCVQKRSLVSYLEQKDSTVGSFVKGFSGAVGGLEIMKVIPRGVPPS
jgi:hypothetical protein